MRNCATTSCPPLRTSGERRALSSGPMKPRSAYVQSLWRPPQSTSNPGKLNAVSGLKYGFHVGFGKEFLSPKIGGLLVEAANQSLGSSTRSLYTSVLKISRETGVLFSYPMTTLMVQNLVATKILAKIEAPLAKTKVDQKRNLRIVALFFCPMLHVFSQCATLCFLVLEISSYMFPIGIDLRL